MERLQRISERALVLPILGFLLFVPPILSLFDGPVMLGGIPLVYLYIFGTWAALIGLAQVLGRRLLKAARTRRDRRTG